MLATHLMAASTYKILSRAAAECSALGIGYLAITAIVMLMLARLNRTTVRAASSAPLADEASMTFLDGWLGRRLSMS